MWLFTKDGFFSVVKNEYCKGDDVAVRSRTKDDLVRVCENTKTPVDKIIETPSADYRYRVHLKSKVWKKYVSLVAENIDYPNFKNAVHGVDPDRSRLNAYHECWGILHRWQQTKP